jgi:hypothetical protein
MSVVHAHTISKNHNCHCWSRGDMCHSLGAATPGIEMTPPCWCCEQAILPECRTVAALGNEAEDGMTSSASVVWAAMDHLFGARGHICRPGTYLDLPLFEALTGGVWQLWSRAMWVCHCDQVRWQFPPLLAADLQVLVVSCPGASVRLEGSELPYCPPVLSHGFLNKCCISSLLLFANRQHGGTGLT